VTLVHRSELSSPDNRPVRWDLYCRVIDNFGDAGVCWRLAADLGARGDQVRLVIDDPAPLAWMAPQGAAGVEVRRWDDAISPLPEADVVVEAFGCELPAATIVAMRDAARPPVWINLEYLSAEAYVERSHRLPSPQHGGIGDGLVKWFFYPGFTPATGGLLREPGLIAQRQAFDAAAWLASHGLQRTAGERVVSLFCYENAALPDLLDRLADEPTLLLVTAGHPARQVQAALGPALRRGHLRAALLPLMPQPAFDHLLWAADLNFVRGEDSWVRAQWAGAPFVWQAYPQSDEAHRVKIDAFLDRFLAGAPALLASAIGAWWRSWNEGRPLPRGLPRLVDWGRCVTNWRERLCAQPDLTTQLTRFVTEKR
jgi:uncharacterized repeat protein (TIGR03837 family)